MLQCRFRHRVKDLIRQGMTMLKDSHFCLCCTLHQPRWAYLKQCKALVAREDRYYLAITISIATNRISNGQWGIQRSLLDEESQLEEDKECQTLCDCSIACYEMSHRFFTLETEIMNIQGS
jgi:hypothetical protein